MRAIIAFILILFSSCVSLGLTHFFNSTDTSKGNLYFNMAERFYSDSKYDSSSFYYNKAAESYLLELKYKKYLKSLNYSAIDFGTLSEYETGMQLLKEGFLFTLEKFGIYDSLTAVLLNSLGSLYYKQEDYENAMNSYNLSLKIKLKIFGRNHNETALAYHNLGLVWNYLGNYEKALEYINRALIIWLPIPNKAKSSIGNCYINIANVYANLQEYDKCIKYDLKALETWKDVFGENHRYIAMSYNNLSDDYTKLGDYKNALLYANKALNLNIKIFGAQNPKVALNKSLIARMNIKSGNFTQAKKYLNEAMKIWNQHPNNKNKNETLIQLADWNLQSHNFNAALQNYDSILTSILPEALNSDFNPEESIDNYIVKFNYLYAISGKGDVYYNKYKKEGKSISDLQKANYWFDLYSKVLRIFEKKFRRENSKLELGKSLHKNNSKLLETIYDLYKITNLEDYKLQAYSIIGNTKANVLSNAIHELGAKKFSNIPDSLLKLESEMQRKLEKDYKDLDYAEEESEDIEEIQNLQRRIFETNQMYDKLVDGFEKKYPEYYRLKYESSAIEAEEIKNNFLDSNSALVEYFTKDSSLFIFSITNEDIEIERISSIKLEKEVKKFRNALQNLEFEDYVISASKLYKILIKPLIHTFSNKKKIYVIPDGILNYLPFEALISKEIDINKSIDFSKISYLIKDFELVYHYSSNLLFKDKNNRTNTDYSFVGFAPVFSENQNNIKNIMDTSLTYSSKRSVRVKNKIYSELPFSEIEVTAIANLFKKQNLNAKSYVYESAREEVIKSDDISNYNIIHIASHGFINEKKPRLSGILFWENDSTSNEDAILYLGEIFNLHLNSELVVLSACESGLGKLVKGEGIIGLSRGFIYSGVDNLIISLWQVADKSTAELMLNFYNNLLYGYNHSKSLRLAKLKLISEKKYAYPLEWSPFILVGK